MNDVYFDPRAGEISLSSPSHRGHNETHRFEKRGGGGIYHEKRIRGDWDPITELIISPASVKIARYYRGIEGIEVGLLKGKGGFVRDSEVGRRFREWNFNPLRGGIYRD